MSLREVLRWSHREFLAWDRWLDDEMNRPDRSDNYLMQLTSVVASMFAKNSKEVTPDKFKIEFERVVPGKPRAAIPENAKVVSQVGVAKVLAKCGDAKVTYKTRPASEVQPW